MRRIGIILACLLCLAAFNATAAHTQARLILSADTPKPGGTVWAGVELRMEPGWHTYWKNPGAAGMATKIEWQLPPGISAGPIEWPLPEKLPPAEVTTYGYDNEVVLLAPLKLADDLKPGLLKLKANVSWLECKDVCIPAGTNVQSTLNIGNETRPSADAALLRLWQTKIPQTNAPFSFRAWLEQPTAPDLRPLVIEGDQTPVLTKPPGRVDFFPDAANNFEVRAATDRVPIPAGFCLRKLVKKFSGNWPKEISGVMVMDDNGRRKGYAVHLLVADKMPVAATIPAAAPGSMTGSRPDLPLMLLYAFIGGLILNVMPCVLPVIALKILGFVSEARSEPRRVRNLGLLYALGVLVSFLALAGIVIGVKAAGHRAGWGMQFGSPIFIVCLTTLVTLVALNLFGVFQVTLGGRALNSAGELASRHGAPGAFFNGVLATALATPCTAPVLATAVGFALLQGNPAVVILIFLAVGVGLAAPYVALICNPVLLKFLPKPGAWMERFKIAMGFPMLATAVWLFNLAYDDYGKNVLWLGVFLVVVALAAWIFGEFVQRGRRHQSAAALAALIVLLGGYLFALERELDWRAPVVQTASSVSLKDSTDGINWQPWSPEAVAQARAAGHPVLVDFTADWCLTCQVNKKLALEAPSVAAKLKALDAVALVADYTHFPERITAELNLYHRAGVPLVLIYPRDAGTPPLVLPTVLTPGIVLTALARAAGPGPSASANPL
ncbi:MAG: thioredoxin family protein [Verrucomicrobiota bacterium]|nr:thioredoxin family protein [Verrucomicrobiota bacterium]